MDDSRIRNKKVAFSNENGCVLSLVVVLVLELHIGQFCLPQTEAVCLSICRASVFQIVCLSFYQSVDLCSKNQFVSARIQTLSTFTVSLIFSCGTLFS